MRHGRGIGRRHRTGSLALSAILPLVAASVAHGSLVARHPQRAQFRADVDRVRIDVIVTDADGRFVDDLTAADFELTEDGVRQAILSVQLVDLEQERVVTLAGEPEPPAAAGADVATGGAASAVDDEGPAANAAGRLAPSAPGGQVIMLIDLDGLRWKTKARISVYLENWLEDAEALTLPWAMYLLTAEDELYELAPPGRDLPPLRNAIGWLRSFRWIPGAPFGAGTAKRGMLNDRVVQAEALGELAASGPRFAVPRFAAELAAGKGRTALVWVTTRPTGTFVGREIHRAANSANVSIYVVDPTLRHLSVIPIADPAVSYSQRFLADSEGLPKRIAAVNEASFSRRVLEREIARRLGDAAEATGGRLLTNWTDFDEVLDTIISETSRYYLLTYAPPPPAGDGRYHEVGVRVARPGVEVRARRGYVDYATHERDGRLVNAFRTLRRVGGRISLESEAFVTWTPAGEAEVLLASSLDHAELGRMPARDRPAAMARDRPAAVARDRPAAAERDRPPTGAREGAEPRYAVGLRATAFQEEQEPLADLVDLIEGTAPVPDGSAGADTRLTHLAAWRPDASVHGEVTLDVVAVDQASNRSSQLRLSIDIPDPDNGWRISTPFLVQALDRASSSPSATANDQHFPLAGGRATAGEPLGVYVQVAGGDRPTISARIISPAIDLELAQRTLASRGEIHEGMLRLPTDLPPGDYDIELTVSDDPLDQREEVPLTLHIDRR